MTEHNPPTEMEQARERAGERRIFGRGVAGQSLRHYTGVSYAYPCKPVRETCCFAGYARVEKVRGSADVRQWLRTTASAEVESSRSSRR